MVWILELRDPGSSDEQKEGDFTSSLELLTRFSEFSRRIDAKKLKEAEGNKGGRLEQQ